MSSTLKPIPAPKLRVPFSRLPRKERIKIVAKDALKRYKAKQLLLKPGTMAQIGSDVHGLDVQMHMLSGRPCHVCALGAAACAIAAIEDRMAFHKDLYSDGFVIGFHDGEKELYAVGDRLYKLFGRHLTGIIEATFEHFQSVYRQYDFDDNTVEAIEAFCEAHTTHEARFLTIFHRLARTGDFKL